MQTDGARQFCRGNDEATDRMLLRLFSDKTEAGVAAAENTIVIDAEPERSMERGTVGRKHSQYDTILVQDQRPRKRPSVARKLYVAWLQILTIIFHPLIESRVGRWWSSLGVEEDERRG